MVWSDVGIFGVVFLHGFGNIVGEVDCKQRKYDHAAHWQHHGYDFSGNGHRRYVAADGGEVHAAPPQGCPVGVDLGIDPMLAGVENQGTVVAQEYHYAEVAHEKACNGVARQVAHDD